MIKREESWLTQYQHWRRRFFSVQGSKLTAYHEHTHQKRAVINLTKAARVVDDRRTLIADPNSGNPSSRSGRRKSAFAEEDEGYQYVEEGFRIRFANGETIDFYADSAAEKEVWMKTFAQVIGKRDQAGRKQLWTDLVLAHERTTGAPAAPAQQSSDPLASTQNRDFAKSVVPPARESSNRKPVAGAKSAPTSPVKGAGEVRGQAPPHAPPPLPTGAKRPGTPPLQPRTGHRSRGAVKSMIF